MLRFRLNLCLSPVIQQPHDEMRGSRRLVINCLNAANVSHQQERVKGIALVLRLYSVLHEPGWVSFSSNSKTVQLIRVSSWSEGKKQTPPILEQGIFEV
jgi:hypothetical protein